MREMGNWREYQIERLANDREAAIDYLQINRQEGVAGFPSARFYPFHSR